MKQKKETQSFTIPDPRFAWNVPIVNLPSFVEEVFQRNYMVGQPKKPHLGPAFRKIPCASTSPCWRTSFKTEVCSGSNYPSEAMRWIGEVEMAASADELKTTDSFAEDRSRL